MSNTNNISTIGRYNDKKNSSLITHNTTTSSKDPNQKIYFKKRIDAGFMLRYGHNRQSSSTPITFRPRNKSAMNTSDTNRSLNSSQLNSSRLNNSVTGTTRNRGSNSVGANKLSQSKLNESGLNSSSFFSKKKININKFPGRNLTPPPQPKKEKEKEKPKVKPRSFSAKNNIANVNQKKMTKKFSNFGFGNNSDKHNKSFLNMSYIGNKNSLKNLGKNTNPSFHIKKDPSKLSNMSAASTKNKKTNLKTSNIFSSMKRKENNKIFMSSEPKTNSEKAMFAKLDKSKKALGKLMPKKHTSNSERENEKTQDIIEEMKNENTLEDDNKKINHDISREIVNNSNFFEETPQKVKRNLILFLI